MGNSGCLLRGKPAATEARYSTYGACWVLLCFHNPPNCDRDHGIFNMNTNVIYAFDCTRGCKDTAKESALKDDPEREKIPCRTGESNLRRRHVGPMLYQLSYIPTLLAPCETSLKWQWKTKADCALVYPACMHS